MPIVNIEKSSGGPSISKICQRCKQVDIVKADDLVIGDNELPDGIRLPSCSKCHAWETLIRTTDPTTPPSISQHRAAVNALAEYLLSKGKVHPDAAAFFAQQAAEGIKSTPIGSLYGAVRGMQQQQQQPVSTSAPTPGSELALALEALKAAQAAVQSAQKK